MTSTSSPLATSASPYKVYTGHDCLPITVEVDRRPTLADPLWLGLGFFLGFLVGAIIAVLLALACKKDQEKRRKHQDDESLMFLSSSYKEKQVKQNDANSQKKFKGKQLQAAENMKKKRKGKKKGLAARKKNKMAEEEAVVIPWVDLSEADKTGEESQQLTDNGLVVVVLAKSEDGMDAEIANQDYLGVVQLEREFQEENVMALLLLMQMQLNRLVSKGKIPPEFAKQKSKELLSDLPSAVRACQSERDEKEEQLRQKYKKDNATLEIELQKLHPAYILRLRSVLNEEREKFRHDLATNTELTESEVEALMAEHAESVARLEQRQAAERARHMANLEEKLAHRSKLAQQVRGQDDKGQREVDYREDAHDQVLHHMMGDGKILERQRDELIGQYHDNMRELQLKQNEEYEKQQLHLAEKLRSLREKKMKKLDEIQEKQRDEYIRQASRGVQTGAFVDDFHHLLQQQRNEREEMTMDMDAAEAQELKRLQQGQQAELVQGLDRKDREMKDKLFSMAHLSDRDIDRIMRQHEQQMDELNRMRQSEKKRSQMIIEEKLAQKRARANEEKMRQMSEQQALDEQQENMINKVLSAQVGLSDEAKEKILQEHQQNMQAMHNQLEMSKLRQQKQLEQKLGARRAKLAALKQQCEEKRQAKKNASQKEKDKLEKELQKEIKLEEKRIEEEQKQQLAALRQRLAEETAALLAEQEKQLGMLIAKLQVGAARRQAIIQKQDKAIKDLEEQMAARLEDNERRGGSNKVDQLLQYHQNQVEHLTDHLQSSKERQEQVLMEKLQAKRLKKERDIEQNLEQEAQQEWYENKKRGAGLATSILSQTMLDQRHRAAMQQLEREMNAEMQRQREALDAEMEKELQQEMQEQKKVLLAQLAAVSNMSAKEVNNLVQGAVEGTGGQDEEARKLAKELRQEMKRAKTELGLGQDNQGYDEYEMRRGRTDLDGSYGSSRPLSSRGHHRRPKSAFREEYDA